MGDHSERDAVIGTAAILYGGIAFACGSMGLLAEAFRQWGTAIGSACTIALGLTLCCVGLYFSGRSNV